MAEEEYINIMEAARRCGVSDKTIRRAIHAGKLQVHRPKSNVALVAVSDLEKWRQLSADSIEHRMTAMEQRIRDLEQAIDLLLGAQTTPTKKQRLPKLRTTGSLPKQLVALLTFADLHGVAHKTVLAHVENKMLPAVKGQWTGNDGTPIATALDLKGQSAFYRIYHGVPPFTDCPDCPHTT